MDKIRVGFFSFTCCEGCIVSFVEVLNKKFFEYKEKFDFVHLRILRPDVGKIQKMDIAFVEGAISNKDELKKLKEIRKKSKKLVAFGSGAINGWPSNLSNEIKGERRESIEFVLKKIDQLKKISPITDFVKIDDKVPGCPVEEKVLIKKINSYIKEKKNA